MSQKRKSTTPRRRWLDEAKYLPEFMRDFHDQKDIFRAIHQWAYEDEPKEPLNWVEAHIYTVDMFLTYMAVHGYTLQRSRAQIEFNDLSESLKEYREKRVRSFKAMLNAEQKHEG